MSMWAHVPARKCLNHLSSHRLCLSLNSSPKSLNFYQLLHLLPETAQQMWRRWNQEPTDPACGVFCLWLLWQSSDRFLCVACGPNVYCVSPSPSQTPQTLTIVAVLLQVLLELVRSEAGVLVDPKVSQAFCRGLGVCVLHPFWID